MNFKNNSIRTFWPAIIFFLFTAVSSSCKKYLDAKPDYSQSTPDGLADLQAILDDAEYMNKRSPSIAEAPADDYFLPEATYNSLDDPSKKIYTWNLTDYTFPDDWASLYTQVYNANLCLESLQKIDRTDANRRQWDNVKGSALFFRAYAFLTLTWTFSRAYDNNSANSDYGIALRTSSDFNVPSTRATVEDSYRQILKDFKEALPYLPDLQPIPLRPSKVAVYGGLARTYLSMRIYDSAFTFANEALQLNDHLSDYNNVDTSSLLPFTKYNEEVIFHSVIGQHTLSSAHPDYARIDSTLYNSYDHNDLRKRSFFSIEGDGVRFKGMYNDNPYLPFTGIATDEMYLTRAECEARLNKVSDALNDLNTLLEKRFVTGTFVPIAIADPSQVLDTILAERRKELVMRTLRWIDIKRLNKEGRGITPTRMINGERFTLVPNDNKYAIPLPADIIKLTGMPQNPL
jgi:tetratricopeptide (TPR) repeat protein